MITPDISRKIWDSRYRHRTGGKIRDATIDDTWRRVATALAAAEAQDRAGWAERFHDILRDFRFLPGGRIQAGAGTGRNVTLFNCFVMGTIEDSPPGISRALREGAATMRQGGGVGYDFSTLRPHGTRARGTDVSGPGPVSCMHMWDAMCATVLSTGGRRGAMMATLRCDHPDISAFIAAKREPEKLLHFNLSVQVTDAFMDAVRQDADWLLVFPAASLDGEGEMLLRDFPGQDGAVACRILGRVQARALWGEILHASYDRGEPGVLFIDRINRMNNLSYCERITATNPCGEIPLPPYGACDLGSVNLTRLIREPFTPRARLDRDGLECIVTMAVRCLDNVIDISRFPLPRQRESVLQARRIGLGLTGLADALTMLGLRYGNAASLAFAEEAMRTICFAAYRASVALAREKGSFPAFECERYLAAPFIRALPADIRDGIARHGIRNSHLTAIAPTGTISLLAGNISSGMEPAFAPAYRRTVLDQSGQKVTFDVVDDAVRQWRDLCGDANAVPDAFVAATDLLVMAHLEMQAVLQPYVDNAISKTINVPESCGFAAFAQIYDQAYAKGLKGCTAFRPSVLSGAVLSRATQGMVAPHCCVPERATD